MIPSHLDGMIYLFVFQCHTGISMYLLFCQKIPKMIAIILLDHSRIRAEMEKKHGPNFVD